MKKSIMTVICAVLSSTSFAYYQSEQGRWINRDPVSEEGAKTYIKPHETKKIQKQMDTTIRPGPYLFVNNMVPNTIDLLGLQMWDGYMMGNSYHQQIMNYERGNAVTHATSELHGGVGKGNVTVSCCGDDNHLYEFEFKKICGGYQLGGAFTGGYVSGISHCDEASIKDQYSGKFLELGFGMAILSGGIDYGLDDNFSPTGVNEYGTGFGYGLTPFSVSLCEYEYIGKKENGCCK